ncbi:DUF2147 domain-containing protein [Dyella sp. 2HG41-7]|uniref:DUF2147 domain-containing protein n=1 Tax=Dyella sp. 2HG41-7 TaxID=2883239 RepID=UPI001F2281E2|nr:DUF2147 domain-containing protein [Dyella sp. 2HG41-7]
MNVPDRTGCWRRVWQWALLMLLCCASAHALAQEAKTYSPSPSAIVGDWLVESRDAVIRIQQIGNQYQGYIVWQLHDTYGPEDGPELNGKIVTDRKNPDPALRSRTLDGLPLLTSLRFEPDKTRWIDGRIYNADNGRTYNCLVRMLGPNRLQLRGFIGISLFGGNTVWSRVTMRTPAPGQLPFVEDAPAK